MMRTLGVDLAAQDKKTAVCAIEWSSEQALVELPAVGRPEVEVLAAMQRADWIGIDAPFGWPEAMVEAVHAYATTDAWPATATPQRLRYQQTDWFVHNVVADEAGTSVWPLSVSSDRIAVCAWRCANLLSAYSRSTGWKLDRIGVPVSTDIDGAPDPPRPPALMAAGGVVEVYPAAALALWGLPHKGYKSTNAGAATAARDKRWTIMRRLEQLSHGWLILTHDVRDACIESDDAFDAFVSSLVACAAATTAPTSPSLSTAAPRSAKAGSTYPRRRASRAWHPPRARSWAAGPGARRPPAPRRHARRARRLNRVRARCRGRVRRERR